MEKTRIGIQTAMPAPYTFGIFFTKRRPRIPIVVRIHAPP